MYLVKKHIVLIFLFFAVHNCISSGTYCAETLKRDKGIYQGTVNVVMEDSRGFIWIGTSNGLFRYDGRESVNFRHDPDDSSSISTNSVYHLVEDKYGFIWANDLSDISRLNPVSGKFKHYRFFDDAMSNMNLSTIRPTVDSLGQVWYSGWSIDRQKWFLFYFNFEKDKLIQYHFFNDYVDSVYESGGYIPRFAAGRNGDIFLKNRILHKYLKYDMNPPDTPKYCFLIFNKQNKSNRSIPFYKDYGFEKIIGYDNEGNMLIEAHSKDEPFIVLKLNLETDEYTETNYKVDKRWYQDGFMVTSSYFDGQMFVTVKINDGVKERKYSKLTGYHRFNDSNYLPFDNSGRMHFNSSYAMAKTFYWKNKFFSPNNKIIWDYYCNDIIKIYKKTKNIENISLPLTETGNSNYLSLLYKDKDNQIWAGTYNGLYKYLGNGKFKHYFFKLKNTENRKNRITGISEIDKNTFIIGTLNGLLYFNKKTGVLTDYNTKNKIEQFDDFHLNKFARCISVDKDTIWAGTVWGLNKFLDRTNKYRIFLPSLKDSTRISGRLITCLYRDSKGQLWIGTGSGLNKFLPGLTQFKKYITNPKVKSSISGNLVQSICEDKSGYLWIASYGGLSRYIPETDNFITISKKEGLPEDEIASMTCDNDNNLWLGTKNGLIKYDQTNGKFTKYMKQDGFQGNEYYQNCAISNDDGSLVFGGENGLSVFKPNELKKNQNIPRIAVSKLYLNDSLISYYLKDGDTIRKKWNSDYLKIHFAAFDYIAPDMNQFAFKIDGIHKEWIQLGTQNSIILSGLEPGNYTLRIKASNNDGIWNEKGIAIKLLIVPPYWKTSWFRILVYILILLVILIVVYAIYQRKRDKEISKKRVIFLQLKALQAQINPHFIFNSLNSILNLIVHDEKRSAVDYLSKFSKLLRKVIDRSRNNSISLVQEIELIELYIELECMRFENKFKYSIIVDENIDTESTMVPPLFLQPYIENSIKHGKIYMNEAGKIDLIFKEKGSDLDILIIDNGVGRQKAQESIAEDIVPHKSYGMEISRERLKMINSEVVIEDVKDETGEIAGTQIEIIINNYKKNYGLN